jgi:hypothetical protein
VTFNKRLATLGQVLDFITSQSKHKFKKSWLHSRKQTNKQTNKKKKKKKKKIKTLNIKKNKNLILVRTKNLSVW